LGPPHGRALMLRPSSNIIATACELSFFTNLKSLGSDIFEGFRQSEVKRETKY
jgi:hypothetical protein